MENEAQMENEINFQKVDVEVLKLDVGENFVGTLIDETVRPWTDKKTGEVKELVQLHFESPKGESFIYFKDAGLGNALSTANIKIGDLIKVEKMEKVNLGGGQTVNSYSIYKAVPRS